MTEGVASLAENTAQRCFHWRVGDVCYLGGGSQPLPKCILCPNWIDRKDWSKTWFTLQRPESAVEGTGLQGVFTIEPDAEGGKGAEAEGGTNGETARGHCPGPSEAPAVPAPGKPRSLFDYG